jgi:ketosteroid isomerase-like protein
METQAVLGGGTEADHQMLRDMKALYERSISNNQLDNLVGMLDENFSFVTFTDSEFDIKKHSFEEFKKEWNDTREQMLDGGSYQVTLDPERSVIFDNTAVARGIAHHKITKGNGKTYEFPGQWTVILKKSPQGWKIVRAHSSVSSMNNSMLHDYVKTKLVKVGAISGAFCLLLGVLITYLVMKSRLAG